MSTQAVPSPVSPLKSWNYEQLKAHVQNAPGDVVEGLLPVGSVNLWAGDSGLGKSALVIQLGICVAAGKPFLGQAVRLSAKKVLLVDFENSRAGLESLVGTISCYI